MNRYIVTEYNLFVQANLIQSSNPLTIYAYQYLIFKGYAVPLWFGVNHWANGKTAIELGIAIDKTLNPQQP